MPTPPAWLNERVTALAAVGPVLFVGAKLSFSVPSSEVAVRGLDELESLGGPYAAAVVAAANELSPLLSRVRSALSPGGQITLLLPQSGRSMLAAFAAQFGALGRAGREPRSLETQCGALLASGFVDVVVVPEKSGEPAVQARLPSSLHPLDATFGSGAALV